MSYFEIYIHICFVTFLLLEIGLTNYGNFLTIGNGAGIKLFWGVLFINKVLSQAYCSLLFNLKLKRILKYSSLKFY